MVIDDVVTVPNDGLLFYYRHPEAGPWMKRTVWLPDASVLAFFRRAWREAPASGDAREWLRTQLGGPVYGFGRSLSEAMAKGVASPESLTELRSLLLEHLYVEGLSPDAGDDGPLRLDERTLRVKTDDDEQDLTYGFLPAPLLRDYVEQLAFLAYAEPKLPSSCATASDFEPVCALQTLEPGGGGAGTTYVISITINETCWLDSMTGNPASRKIDGVRVPDLVSHLRRTVPSHTLRSVDAKQLKAMREYVDQLRAGGREQLADRAARQIETHIVETWPSQWLTMRASIAPEANSLEDVLTAWRRHRAVGYFDSQGVPQAQGEAHRRFCEHVESFGDAPGVKGDVVVDTGPHHAVMHRAREETWVFFDDLWATAHPHLANSLLLWGLRWDPMESSK